MITGVDVHELGLAENTLDLALMHLARLGAEKIVALTIRVGALSGVDGEALRYALEIITRGTAAEQAAIHLEDVRPVCYCVHCEESFDVEVPSYACPRCGKLSANLLAGNELDLVSMEVD